MLRMSKPPEPLERTTAGNGGGAIVPQLLVQYGFRLVFPRQAAHYLYTLYFAVRGHRAAVLA